MKHIHMMNCCMLVFILLGLASCSGAQTTEIKLKNADFENWSGSGPNDWFISDESRKRGEIEFASSPIASGERALRLLPGERNGQAGDPLSIGQILPINALGGTTLQVEVSMAAEGEATAVLGLAILGADGQPSEFKQLRQDATEGLSFFKHSTTLRVPKKAKDMNMLVYCAVEGISGAAYFDGFRVRVGSGGSEEVGGDSGVLAASITVDPNHVVQPIPHSMFGTNVEWINNGNEIWDVDRNGLRSDVIREAQSLGITLIRFPGGVFSDYYDWRNGIGNGPRKTTIHYPDGPKSTHYFGTDEALDFANKVGARLLITVNAGSGTPEDAAAWVEYVNGKNGKNPRKDRVEYWEIGNELYTKEDASGGSLPPKDYAKKVKDFAKAMRAVDPTIKIGAIGGINQGTYNVVDYRNWTQTVLSEVGSEIDFLAIHNAYAPVVIFADNATPDDVYKALLAAPVRIANNLGDIAEAINENVPPGKRPVIAITEWGPLFHIMPSNEWVDHVKTMGSAVYVADVLRVFLETPNVEVANFFKLTESSFMGWLGPDKNGTFIPKPTGLAFRLFSQHFGNAIVSTSVESPTFKTEGVGMVASVPNAPLVTSVSSVSPDRKRIFVIAINKDLHRAAELAIRIPGAQDSDSVPTTLLSGASPDSHTGTKLIDIPGFTWAKQNTYDSTTDFNAVSMANVALKESVSNVSNSTLTYSLPPHSIVKFEVSMP